MSTPSPDLVSMFQARTHARRLAIAKVDRATGTRVGGAPPDGLAASRCPRCDQPHHYVATFEEDAFGVATARGQALSLLACSGACLGRATSAAAGFAVVTHPATPRGAPTAWQWAPRGRGLDVAPSRRDVDADGGPLRGAKIGGRPRFVDLPLATAVGAAFLAQLPDDVGPAETGGPYLLGGAGTIYLYGAERDAGPSLDRTSVEVELS